MFNHLFKPLKIGNVELRNRIVMLPITTGYCESDETVGDRFIDFFVERAKGGAGLIIIPFSPVPAGAPVEPGIFDDRFLPGVHRLTAAIRNHGAKSACQLITSYHVIFGGNIPEVVGPSEVLNQILRITPRAVTIDEIRFIVEQYAHAARRVREGGFDMVEILVGGGYFLNRFLSPISNIRQDEYGGSLENRMRIILEIIAGMQKAAGADFPIGVRLNVDEQMPGGHTIEDSKPVARKLEQAGVRLINCYTGWHESPVPTVAPSLPKGAFAHLASAIRKVIDVPVIAANRINDLVIAEKILADSQADLIGMGRALLADPELPEKARTGRIDEIVPCIACSRCLGEILSIYKTWGVGAGAFCTVNPAAGREASARPESTPKPKKVFIVGGGPAGLEAARVAATRGHKVTLFEKEAQTGGWLRIGCLPPHKQEIGTLATNLAVRAKRAGAQLQLNSNVNPEVIAAEKPDTLIVAAGAHPATPAIAGVDAPHVVAAEDVLTGRKTVGGKVVIIGGGLVGCETAEFLLEKGGVTTVTVVEMLERMAATISPTYRPFFLARIKQMGVRMETHTTVTEILEKGVRVNRKGEQVFIDGDFVILAVGLKADPSLERKFGSAAAEVFFIGDCVEPRMIKEAIEEGFAVGMKI